MVRRSAAADPTGQGEQTAYRDVLEACRNERCAVLVGEPGAGKTTTLLRRAHELAAAGPGSVETPLPLFARLRNWDPEQETLETFLSGQFAPLGDAWLALLQREQALLLLDGLNELPVQGRAQRVREISDFLEHSRAGRFLLSSRLLEYEEYRLPYPCIQILPLKPSGVFGLTRAVLRFELEEDADALQRRLFWEHLAGDAALEAFQGETRLSLDDFFDSDRVPELAPPSGPRWRCFLGRLPVIGWRFSRLEWVRRWVWGQQQDLWRQHNTERSLLRLASNPFWLTLMLSVFLEQGRLPEERIALMQSFVRSRLVREKLAGEQSGEPDGHGKRLLAAVADFAFALQSRSGEEGARVGMARDQAAMLDDDTLKLALGCGFIVRAGDSLSFAHQLFQEYFALEGLQREYGSGRLRAQALWPLDGWWRAGGWEETARFLAGRYAGDPNAFQRFLGWLAPANPRLLADCAQNHGIAPEDSVCEALARVWLPRMTDSEVLPDPQARAAVGLVLGSLGLDSRPGVGLDADGLPAIEWVEIPAGEFIYQEGERYQEGEKRTLPAFHIARYQVTNEQFRAFLKAADGHRNREWWAGFESEYRKPKKPSWNEGNCPRETVEWYQALAFCRWLSAQRGFEIRLPTEQEWERAACFTDEREYPWGSGYRSRFANVDETETKAGPHYLGRTSPVGIYPLGRSVEGVDDLSGNVWEWCLNKHENPEITEADTSGDLRVERGGSWLRGPEYARAAIRGGDHPDLRYDYLGFRVLCAAPIRSGH